MTKTVAEHMSWTRHHWTLTFFYCLLLALFVTVCIYVYAGEQQNLGARKFGNVNVNGTLNLETEVVTFTKDTTISFNGDKIKTYVFTGTSDVTVTMPSAADIITAMNVKKNGVRVYLGNIINLGTAAITLSWANNGNLKAMTPLTGTSQTINAGASNTEFNMERHTDAAGTQVVVWMD